MNETDLIAIIIKGATELLAMVGEWIGGKPPTPERVEIAWSTLEQVKAKVLTDAKERARYGEK
jgi:hypothetical protein